MPDSPANAHQALQLARIAARRVGRHCSPQRFLAGTPTCYGTYKAFRS